MFNNNYADNYEVSDIENIFDKEKFRITITDNDLKKMKELFNISHSYTFNTNRDYEMFINKSKCHFNKTKLIRGYRMLISNNDIKRNQNLERFMRLKVSRGNSGVVVITTFMSGTQFGNTNNIKNGGCPENCHYCPFEKDDNGIPTQPRSYLSTEPGNKRATQNKHHPVGQLFDRVNTLEKMGHISSFSDVSSKIEVIISGGTFNFFPEDYIIWYVTSTYYALNVYYDYTSSKKLREMLSLEEEQKINETASLRMIGLTIETRPDRLYGENDMFEVVKFFRELGVTRVQIGIQHTDDSILKYVNRNCTNQKNKDGIKILKQNGFKTDIHLMLDLPMPSVDLESLDYHKYNYVIDNMEKKINEQIPDNIKCNVIRDLMMIDEIINDPDYQADQWKVYPTETTPFTKILEWYENEKYVPYAEFKNGILLESVIVYLKTLIHDYIRINRIVRDIPPESIYGGIKAPDMRNNILIEMKKLGKKCNCIRCREVKGYYSDNISLKLFINKYESSGGIEYFISYENIDKTILYGMIRLRINKDISMVNPILYNCALIRELHVYGIHSGIGDNTNISIQHKGIGKKLIKVAEEIAYKNGCNNIVVISGVGVREYYRKNGFTDYYTYMIKNVNVPFKYLIRNFIIIILIIAFYLILMF